MCYGILDPDIDNKETQKEYSHQYLLRNELISMTAFRIVCIFDQLNILVDAYDGKDHQSQYYGHLKEDHIVLNLFLLYQSRSIIQKAVDADGYYEEFQHLSYQQHSPCKISNQEHFFDDKCQQHALN